MKEEFRIFKDISGGQILGATYDYTHRLIDFDLIDEKKEESLKWLEEFNNIEKEEIENQIDLRHLPKMLDYLRQARIT